MEQNLIQLLSELSGVSEKEISWAHHRISELLAEGKTKEEAVKITKEENPYKHEPVKDTKFKEAINKGVNEARKAACNCGVIKDASST